MARQGRQPARVARRGQRAWLEPYSMGIPRHRVLRSGGALGGYDGGVERKRWLLELEGALGSEG